MQLMPTHLAEPPPVGPTELTQVHSHLVDDVLHENVPQQGWGSMKGLLSQQGEILQFCTQSCRRSKWSAP